MSGHDDGTRSCPAGVSRRSLLISLGIVPAMLLGQLPAQAGPIEDLFSKSKESSGLSVDHSPWDRLLKTYVKAGSDGLNRVDYASFKRVGHGELKAYITRLEATDVAQLSRTEQFAFLVNLYNAKTVDIVLDRYPVQSIKDISLGGGFMAAVAGGPWKAKVLKLKGVELSLDDIEHAILRPLFRDPRVHYAVNCASIGCPNLNVDAFVGAQLDAQLDAAAQAYVNGERGFRFQDGKLIASSIYHWFKADFGGTDQGVLQHAAKYAKGTLADKLKKATTIDDHGYDWRLNGIPR